MAHEVKVQHRETALVVAKRQPVTLGDIGPVMGAAFGEVYADLGARGIATAGPPFVIYHGMPEGDLPFEIEICAPVGGRVDPPAGWQLVELPAGAFASLVHVGPYDSVGAGYDAITTWIGAHGLEIAGPPREVYLDGPETPAEQIRTIVEFPVTEAPVPVTAG